VKKVLIVAVCLTLVLTLAFTLGASGKKPTDKPDKPGKPVYVNYDVTLKGDVFTKEVSFIPCTGKQGVSTYEKPVPLKLTNTFNTDEFDPSTIYGVYFQLWENKNKGTITMGYWFWYPDKETGEKLMLEVEGEAPHDWLSLESEGFIVDFTNKTARITRTGNRVVWPENGEDGTVSIVVTCMPSPEP